MKITESDIKIMSNLADWKLGEYLKQNKKIDLDEVIKKATSMKQNEMLKKEFLKAEKFGDLISTITTIQAAAGQTT